MLISKFQKRTGAVHFFAKGRKMVAWGKKTRRGRDESQEEQTGTKSPHAASERRTARRAGDDPVEERTPQGDVARD
jgi:hypothetical protein